MQNVSNWQETLAELFATVASRRGVAASESYTAQLLGGNADTLLKKVMEEAGEVALAAKADDRPHTTAELADLFYHCFVLMVRYNITLDDVAAVLAQRLGTSGLTEKQTRQKE